MTVFQVIFAVLLIIANGQEINIEYDSGIEIKDLYRVPQNNQYEILKIK